MTIETYVDAVGDTYYLVHPAGMSYYDQTPETVNKENTSVGFLAGDLAVVTANTIAGEVWGLFSSFPLSGNLGRRQGVVTANSAAGVATISIKRTPRRVVSTAMGGSAYNDGIPHPRSNANGGDSINAGDPVQYNNWNWASGLYLASLASVTKPSSEIWSLSSAIYGYISGGVTSYTNNAATASANLVYWSQGACCLKAGVGVLSAYVHQATFLDPIINTFFCGANTSSAQTIVATQTGTPVAIAVSVYSYMYVSQDRLSVSGAASATCNIILGLCVAIDKTVTPSTYKYIDIYGMYEGGTADAINAGIGSNDLCLVNAVTGSAIRGAGGGATTGYLTIASVRNSSGVNSFLAAPVFASRGDPVLPDMAYEPILPVPFDNLRIIWSYSPGTFYLGVSGLYPAISARTLPSVAPYSGMIISGRDKPQRGSTLSIAKASNINDSGCRYPLIAQSRSTPYVWEGPDGLVFDSSFSSGLNRGQSLRGAMFPSGILYYSGSSTATNFQWRWEIFDFTTSAWVGVTSYVAAIGSGGAWQAVITPPVSGITLAYVYTMRIGISLTGSSGIYFSVYFANKFSYLGAWPYDVVKAYTDTDAGGAWSGNAGWIWPTDPAGPTVAWANEPSFALVGNTLTLSANIPTRTVTPDAKFSDGSSHSRKLGPGISASITYDDGDSARIPTILYDGNTAPSKGPLFPGATTIQSGSSPLPWGTSYAINVYPSRNGSKNITTRIFYSGMVTSAYLNNANGTEYASTRIITQTFTLP
jgi:hypothetical protein